jgi:hypothetical protein
MREYVGPKPIRTGQVRLFSRQAVLNLTGMILVALSLILAVPVFFLIEVLGVGQSGLEILAKRIKMRRSF